MTVFESTCMYSIQHACVRAHTHTHHTHTHTHKHTHTRCVRTFASIPLLLASEQCPRLARACIPTLLSQPTSPPPTSNTHYTLPSSYRMSALAAISACIVRDRASLQYVAAALKTVMADSDARLRRALVIAASSWVQVATPPPPPCAWHGAFRGCYP